MSTRRRTSPSEPSREAGEPSLVELLDDPVLQVLMARDHVERADLEDLIERTRDRLGFAPVRQAHPDILFADCA